MSYCIVKGNLQGLTSCISKFVLPIASEELVLDDNWLGTLETHLVNYKEKFITFLAKDNLVTHFQQFKCLHSMCSITAMYTLHVHLANPPIPAALLELPPNLAFDVAGVLHSFPVVLQPPRAPSQAPDHHISCLTQHR